MKSLVALIQREIGERRQALLAAAVAGLVPFLIPLARGLHGAEASDARQWTALILSVAFGVGLSLGLGLTTLAAEIANRRIGFFWSRPISGWSLWLGKLMGVWLLAVVAALLAFLPSLIVDGARVLPGDLRWVSPEIFFAVLVGVVLVSHALSIVVRSRSLLLVGDLAGLGLAYLVTRALSLRLLRLRAGSAVLTNFTITEVCLAIGILAGGAAAVLAGRILIRRAHRALSLVLWTLVACGLAVVGAHTVWVLTASPSSISRIYWIEPGSQGGWVTLSGYARANFTTFALNVNDGRYARVPTTFQPVTFSGSGKRAVWLDEEARGSVGVISWNMDQASKPLRTHLTLSKFPLRLFLSEDGARLATFDYELLSVYDLDSGALLGSVRAPGRLWDGQALFLNASRIRLILQEDSAPDTRIRILEFDVKSKALQRTGVITGIRLDPFSTVSRDGAHVIVRDRGAEQLLLVNGATGEQEAILADDPHPELVPACFLAGDRIAVTVAQGRRLRVLTENGQIERELALSVRASDLLGAPIEGRLCLSLRDRSSAGILDLSSGRLEELRGLAPVPRSWWREKTDPPTPGNPFSTLFLSEDGSLVQVDPISLQRRAVGVGAASR